MKLYEYQGKLLFKEMGIPIPDGSVAGNLKEATLAAETLGYPVVVKGQVLQGGRGKAGAIRFAQNKADLFCAASEIRDMRVGTEKIDRLLVEKQVPIAQEIYLGISFDPQSAMPLLLVSTHGGVDVESVANQYPHAMIKMQLDPFVTPISQQISALAGQTGLSGKILDQLSGILQNLIRFYFAYEAITAEINPLIIDTHGNLWAADAKVEIDDAALFRLKGIEQFSRKQEIGDPLEAEAREAGVSFVRLNQNGNIGLIAGGAGVGMATMDTVYFYGGVPANFLDLGGIATPEKTAAALKIVLKTPGVEGIFINAFGGINNCREMAEGIVSVIEELHPAQVITVKMRGHSQDEGWSLLEAKDIPVVKYGTTDEGIQLLLDEMRKKGVNTGGHPD
jgi:succinyl-CoA synthetase beta subunit